MKTDIEALTKRIEKLEAQVGKQTGDPLVGQLVEYSNDLGNSLAGNDRILPLMKRLEELETYLDPLFGEKESCSLGVKMSLGIFIYLIFEIITFKLIDNIIVISLGVLVLVTLIFILWYC